MHIRPSPFSSPGSTWTSMGASFEWGRRSSSAQTTAWRNIFMVDTYCQVKLRTTQEPFWVIRLSVGRLRRAEAHRIQVPNTILERGGSR